MARETRSRFSRAYPGAKAGALVYSAVGIRSAGPALHVFSPLTDAILSHLPFALFRVFRGPIRDAKAGAFAYATGKAGRLIERGEIHRLAKKRNFRSKVLFA
jgi:hypothetical protein